MDTSIKVRGKGLCNRPAPNASGFQISNFAYYAPHCFTVQRYTVKIPYKTEFEAFKRFILLDLWAQFLLNGEDWCSARFTHDYTNDGACTGGLGFSNESREQKSRRENPKKKYID